MRTLISLCLFQEAVRSALEYHDVYVQAKCLLYFADISRLRSDHEVSMSQVSIMEIQCSDSDEYFENFGVNVMVPLHLRSLCIKTMH